MLEKKNIKVLVADDDPNIRRSIQLVLQGEGYSVRLVENAVQAFQALSSSVFDLALLDVRMDDVSGIDLYKKMLDHGLQVPTIFISGNASLTEAVQAVRMGAFDFIEKPFSAEKLSIVVSRCLEHEFLKRKFESLPEVLGKNEFIGESPAARRILEDVLKVAKSTATVLIQGESGTGKELIAKLIHENSERKTRPFIKVNCSAIPENLIESELFGYDKGAFTGAQNSKRGFFEQANFGTLFLDEIGDMSLAAQAKVLRAIQNSEIQKLGAERVIPINVRLVAATNKDLKAEVQRGSFREDLYYRLSVVPIQSIPLRNRKEDIPLLVHAFVKKICSQNGFKEKTLDSEIVHTLTQYSWPGNIRELQNLIERMVIMSTSDSITMRDLPLGLLDLPKEGDVSTSLSQDIVPLKDFKDLNERKYLISVLRKADGNISRASELLGIERTYLHRKLAQYNIEKREYF